MGDTFRLCVCLLVFHHTGAHRMCDEASLRVIAGVRKYTFEQCECLMLQRGGVQPTLLLNEGECIVRCQICTPCRRVDGKSIEQLRTCGHPSLYRRARERRPMFERPFDHVPCNIYEQPPVTRRAILLMHLDSRAAEAHRIPVIRRTPCDPQESAGVVEVLLHHREEVRMQCLGVPFQHFVPYLPQLVPVVAERDVGGHTERPTKVW